MNILKCSAVAAFIAIVLNSCSLLGIHFKVHNPSKMKENPKFDRESILLGELTPIRQNFDVNFYHLDILLEPENKILGGWVEMRATALKDIDSIQLDLDDNLTLNELRWGTRDGLALKNSRDCRAIFIALPKKVKKGETFSVHTKYYGKPLIASRPPWDGGTVWKKDKQKNHWLGVACELEGASIWFPCKDHTSDEPDSVNLTFAIPGNDLFIVSNGNFMGSEQRGNSQAFHWKVSYPINMYNITYYVGDFAKIEEDYTGINGRKLVINHYVLKPNLEKAKVHFHQVKRHIRIYEELYGEYPWYNDGFKLVESPYAGMEHQSAIAYGNRYKNDLRDAEDYIILHETGHEWFGNAITASDLADMWLQEGFTTYGEALYLEKIYGEDVALKHLRLNRVYIQNKRPLVNAKGRRYYDFKDPDAYVKGAWILHTLRKTINNDSVFFSLVRTFYEENKGKITNSDIFINTTERVTGTDYGWFFDQYLYNHKVPFLEYETTADGNIYFRWNAVTEDFDKLPVKLSFDGDKTVYKVYPNTRVQVLKRPAGLDYTTDIYINDNLALFGKKRNKRLPEIYDVQDK